MRESGKNISRYFFLILFLGFFAGNTFFDHSHLYHGKIIVHSHPFKKSQDGNPEHSHNGSGYQLIYLLNNYVAAVVLGCVLVLAIYFLIKEIAPNTSARFYKRIDPSSIFLRGPPERFTR